jgi:hypothetical protein
MFMTGGGGGHDHHDYSWHSPPGTLSGDVDKAGEATPTKSKANVDGKGPTGDGSIASADTGAKTRQVQFGAAPPESPGGSQRVNIFGNIQTPAVRNPVGCLSKTKPDGYGTIGIVTWVRCSDAIPLGQSIEMNIKVGLYDDDKGPTTFVGQALKLTPEKMTPTNEWKRLVLRFTGFDKTDARVFTVFIERRNDVSNVDVEVWTVKHHFFFEV